MSNLIFFNAPILLLLHVMFLPNIFFMLLYPPHCVRFIPTTLLSWVLISVMFTPFRPCFRYIFKGPDRSSFAINELEDGTLNNIKQWKSLRCLSASEAFWRVCIHEMHFRQPAAEGDAFRIKSFFCCVYLFSFSIFNACSFPSK